MKQNEQNITDIKSGATFVKSFHFTLYSVIKRFFDFIFALIFLILAALPMLAIAVAVKLTTKGTAVFKQKRVGLNGEIFYCFKFRSMYADAPSSCATADLSGADSYITPIGNILRKTSLDELPQLINILKGEMSFIGPRPLIPEETFIHKQRTENGVYNLRPGISGLAQVSGRDFVSSKEKVRLDTEYLNNFGLKEDLKILFKTFFNVLSAKDIHEGTMQNNDNTNKKSG